MTFVCFAVGPGGPRDSRGSWISLLCPPQPNFAAQGWTRKHMHVYVCINCDKSNNNILLTRTTTINNNIHTHSVYICIGLYMYVCTDVYAYIHTYKICVSMYLSLYLSVHMRVILYHACQCICTASSELQRVWYSYYSVLASWISRESGTPDQPSLQHGLGGTAALTGLGFAGFGSRVLAQCKVWFSGSESPIWFVELRLMDKILHDLKDPKLWELWYIPYYG